VLATVLGVLLLGSSYAWAEPTLLLSQDPVTKVVSAEVQQGAGDVTTDRIDVTSDQPNFGHHVTAGPCSSLCVAMTWLPDSRNCNRLWTYTATQRSAAWAVVGLATTKPFAVECPPVNNTPAGPVTFATPVPVTMASGGAATNAAADACAAEHDVSGCTYVVAGGIDLATSTGFGLFGILAVLVMLAVFALVRREGRSFRG